jgi:regulator of sigma E protease
MNDQSRDARGAAGDGDRGQPPSPPGLQRRRLFTAAFILIGLVIAFFMARNAVTSALLFLVILLLLVFVHELGHFATAKAFGIRVHEFGFGFPPRIAGKRWGETEYTVNWLPIGGFVRLEGEENPESPRSLASRPAWQRLIVLGSGGVVNLVLPVFLFAAALSIPHQEAEGRAVVSSVVEGAPAAVAGLRPGDVIMTIEGRDAKNMPEASRLVRIYRGREIEVLVRRDGEFLTIPVESRWAPPAGQGPTGITISPEVVNPIDGRPFTVTVALPPWESIPQATRMTWDTLILARNEVISWFRGATRPELQGPVGIAQITGEVARSSETAGGAISPLLELAALLSINLGILNLLPLPMLDGGRMLFVAVEVVRGGKRVRPEREAIVHLIGFAMFIALALVITFFDIARIASGESVFR